MDTEALVNRDAIKELEEIYDLLKTIFKRQLYIGEGPELVRQLCKRWSQADLVIEQIDAVLKKEAHEGY